MIATFEDVKFALTAFAFANFLFKYSCESLESTTSTQIPTSSDLTVPTTPTQSTSKSERWANLTCHKGWSEKSGDIMEDIATFCDEYDDGKKDCFKQCVLRELGLLTAKFVGDRHNFKKIYDFQLPYVGLITDRYSLLYLLFHEEGASATVEKIGQAYYKNCIEKFSAAKDVLNCSDEAWQNFYNCAENAMKC